MDSRKYSIKSKYLLQFIIRVFARHLENNWVTVIYCDIMTLINKTEILRHMAAWITNQDKYMRHSNLCH